ncbi:MAG: InlB B-repeat-containing protein [Butyrivibrio crossotus]|nr:InlB B-repeat-containing protein [Butyrivibrio crossotus]
MWYKRKHKQNHFLIILFALILELCFVTGRSLPVANAEEATDANNKMLLNGSFENIANGVTFSSCYALPTQEKVTAWNTTATDEKIELFKENTGTYIKGVKLIPSAGTIAAELNAEEESTLYQNVATTPASIYEWGLDHGARNYADTMALVIGPKQTVDPSKQDTNNDGKPDKGGRDQLMQMVDWLIAEGKTSVKASAGIEKHLTVYSKKFAANGTFANNSGNNAFSLKPSAIYTEEWQIWIISDRNISSGTNPWGKYGANDPANSSTGGNLSGDYFYTVPADQTETIFGFVSVGGVTNASGAPSTLKTFGNFLDNINFKIFHPLSGSSTLHGSGVVSDSTGATSGESAISSGHQITVDNHLITYAVDGEPLKVQAVIKKKDADEGCEFVGLYYTVQDTSGNLVTTFLKKDGNEIDYQDNLTNEEKKNKWIKYTNDGGDIIYTYYLDNITTATDLHFVFIKSPTVTYDPNGGGVYTVERTYNTEEACNVYSFKPVPQTGEGNTFTYISPYVSHAAEGKNDGWKFMGWLLTGDTVSDIPQGTVKVNADKLGSLLLPAEHTIACDFSGESTKKEQYFQIWNKSIDASDLNQATDSSTYTKWTTNDSSATLSYANIHKGLTMVAQWRWRQAFLPQINSGEGYTNSDTGGTVEITSVSNTDANYVAAYNANGGKAYFAEKDEIVTAKATAKEGYVFEGWYDGTGSDANLITTHATYSFTEMKENVGTYYARFSGTVTQTYKRQVKDGDNWKGIQGENNDDAGNLDRYSYVDVAGKDISVTATAGEGYKFAGWYDSTGNKVTTGLSSDGKTISYTTTGNATYIARFEKTVTQTFDRQILEGSTWIKTTDNKVGMLTNYTHTDVVGATATSTATAGTGYKFVGWYKVETTGETEAVAETATTTETTLSYTATANATYIARFRKVKVTQTYKRQVKNGETWEATSDTNVGTVAPESLIVEYGSTAGSTATAGTGYEFVGWYDESGNAVAESMLGATSNILSYTATVSATYIARFEKKVTQTFIRQVKDGEGFSNVSENSIGTLTCYTHTDVAGKDVSSTAEAGAGYEFVGWYDAEGNLVASDKLSNKGTTLSYTTTGNATYYARFKKVVSAETVTQTYIRQAKDGDNWKVTTDDSIATLDCYTHTDVVGATASSTATAKEGYEFVGWYDAEGNLVASDKLSNNGKTLSYITTENAIYYALFQRIEAAETVTQTYIRQIKDGNIWGNTMDDTIATLDYYTHTDVVGATASSTATAKEGYEFVGWYDVSGNPVAGDMISNNGTTISYITTGDAIYYARFQKIKAAETVTQTYIRQVKDGDNWKVTTDDSIATLDCYTHTDVVGATASSTATAGKGHKFVGWYDAEGKKVDEDILINNGNTISYTTTGEATYYARFQKFASAENEPQTDNDQGAEAEASKPKSETETETNKNKPETGDEFNPTLWTALFLLSIVALAELNDKRKKT